MDTAMGVINRKTSKSLNGEKKFDWYIYKNTLVFEKTYNRGKGIRKIEFTKKELMDIINFVNQEYTITVSNNLTKMENMTEEDYQNDEYYKKGLGPFILRNADHRLDILYKAQASNQLVAFLVEQDILDHRNKVHMKFYIKYSKERAIKDIENMFENQKDIVSYNKLVRDKIPTILENEGKSCEVEIANKEIIETLLDDKLKQEVNEYLEERRIEDLVDIIEVAFGIAHNLGYSDMYLLRRRNEKFEERGGFKQGVILKDVR